MEKYEPVITASSPELLAAVAADKAAGDSTAVPYRKRSAEKYEPVIEPLLTPREVAAMFRVEVRTVARWAREGKLASCWTAGGRGHRRYREADVRALLGTPGDE